MPNLFRVMPLKDRLWDDTPGNIDDVPGTFESGVTARPDLFRQSNAAPTPSLFRSQF